MLSMGNLARIAKVVALLLFALPWVTISCAEQTLVSMSGVDLVTGNISMTNPMTGATESPPGTSGGDLLVMIGAVLILLSLVATFVLKGGKGCLVAAIGSAAAAACLAYTVLVRIPGEVRANPAAAAGGGGGGGAGGPSPEQIAQMIQVNVQIGFWLVLAALAAAVVLNVLAMKSGAAPAVAAASPPADPPPPAI